MGITGRTQIIDGGGDYLLALKGNQKELHDAARKALSGAINQEVICLEKAHGRSEARAYHVMEAGSLTDNFCEWKELKTIGVALSYRQTKQGKESLEYRYYISSAKLSKARFANAVRSHWVQVALPSCLSFKVCGSWQLVQVTPF